MTLEQSRRRRIVFAAVGGASALYWSKPVVESVLLPAHAQTSPGVTSSVSSSGVSGSGGTTGSGSSGSGAESGSGGSSGGGSSANPTLTMIPPSYTSDLLTGGACVEDCIGSEMLLIVDIYDANGILVGSYQDSATVPSSACVGVDVPSSTFGFSEWPEGYMFVIGASVPDCDLVDSSSGFFTGIKDL